MVFHQRAQAHRGDHAIEHDARAAQHTVGHGFHNADGLAAEGNHDGDHRGDAQGNGVIVAGCSQHGGVFRVGGVRGTADEAGHHGGQTVARHGPVQTGVLGKVAAHHGTVGVHIAHMLYHRYDGYRADDADGTQNL